MAHKNFGGLIVTVIMFFSVVAPVSAASYYVAPSGNDSQSGSLSQPWLTVAKGMVTARSGDTLYLRAGQYNAPATGWQFAQGGVTLTNFPGERVTLYSYSPNSGNYIIKCLLVSPTVNGNKIIGTDVGGQKGIVMTGPHLGISPAILAYQCDDWEVAGIEFRGLGYGIFQRKVNNGNTSADGWYVHDNWVNDFYRESGMQFNGNRNRIENNKIVKVTAVRDGNYGMQLLNLLGNNNVVRGNYLERIDQDIRCVGIFFEWNLSDNNLIENNTIVGVVNGISLWGGDNNLIRNNVMSGTDTAFIIRSWADGTTAYPCNFSDFMPVESDVNNPDWQYMYPFDCRSKNNRFENNTVSGFNTFSAIEIPEASNVFTTGPALSPTPSPPILPSPSPSPLKPGDANGDGKVDGIDYTVWLSHYNHTISGATNGDFNNSGKVDGVDYVLWLGNLNK